ncbi:hypothetical protein E2C01_085443 [Portunus trituberculatus]|uniref:Secreted protein n=1 Tax=Portunus trituberculatus TaxID=210409 RepID=A0A5B7JDM5_PORTR|nr:hypothetical protein [Portunus trituberculatus]
MVVVVVVVVVVSLERERECQGVPGSREWVARVAWLSRDFSAQRCIPSHLSPHCLAFIPSLPVPSLPLLPHPLPSLPPPSLFYKRG